MSTLRGSNTTPAFPDADRIRPQFGSDPATAVLTNGEFATARARRCASSLSIAPSTRISISFFAAAMASSSVAASYTNAADSRVAISIVNARLSRRNADYAAYLYERLQRRGYLHRELERS